MWLGMAARRRSLAPIGALQPPDFDSDQLESVELDGLDARFLLEDVCICSTSLAKIDAGLGRFERVYLKDIDLGESKLRSVELIDVRAEGIDAANGDWGGSRFKRAVFSEARLTGLNLAEAQIEEVSFRACKLDYANFRHSAIKHVSFEDCVLVGADFQGANMDSTRFSGCRLAETDFSKARLARVEAQSSRSRDLCLGCVARSLTRCS
jgi:uncharacterized protein YjbI with pentapeptide repeats